MSCFSTGENIDGPVDIPGADCGDSASASSKNGFVERGRSGRELEVVEPAEGDKARLRKGLLEPKLAAVGDTWSILQAIASVSSFERFISEKWIDHPGGQRHLLKGLR
jgi:hypothetical protein